MYDDCLTLFMVYLWFIFERLLHEDVLVFEYYSLGIVNGRGLVRLTTSTVHLHSFRFAGGILTAGVPHSLRMLVL